VSAFSWSELVSQTSIIQLLRCIGKLLAGAFDVPGGVEVLVPQDLSRVHEIVAVVGQELMGRCMPQQVGVQLDADEGRILVAQGGQGRMCVDAGSWI
jgi:hypothetical protein